MNQIVAIVTDLFFQARINVAARAAGRQVRFMSSVQESDDLPQCSLLLVDLDAATDVLAIIHAFKVLPECHIVAFGPHVDTGRRKAAKAAGADRVLAKSKFAQELPNLLADLSDAGGVRLPSS
jgi:hypothetical protein